MKVCCISIEPTPEDVKKIDKLYHLGKMRFGISIGEVYLVYGLSIINGVVWVEILSNSSGYLNSVPIFLFEILDSRVSKYWEMKIKDTGEILFWPDVFYLPYFHDQLSDHIPDVVGKFEQIHLKMTSEY